MDSIFRGNIMNKKEMEVVMNKAKRDRLRVTSRCLQLGASFKVLELDEMRQSTVPNVFIKGKHIVLDVIEVGVIWNPPSDATNVLLPTSPVFCVELAVDDGKDSDTFVIFDKEMTRLTKQEVVVLAFEEIPTGGEEELPSCLVELSWEGVRRAINNLLPLSEEEGGITTTSSNETVVAAKLGMGGETANPPGNKNVVNTHKHHRE
ncbi:hypothetical protein HID58_048651 [Brassica napus]|uniref:Uncharacterized protein n=1 Tax=Brassica napus TaxID=3708 RepID=A0ABQ8B318_BRANA|nr:hypothetical protein HID58_048651 [Brassica napus]